MISAKIKVLSKSEVCFKGETEKTTLVVVLLDLGNYSTILNTVDKWDLEVGQQYDVTVEYSYNKFKIKEVY
jgi:hypothetical protein